jgi:antitoxin HicB
MPASPNNDRSIPSQVDRNASADGRASGFRAGPRPYFGRASREINLGEVLAEFLQTEGIAEAVEQGAHKKGLAIDIRRIMQAKGVSEAALARLLGTSRTAVRRILDPQEHGTRLDSLVRLSAALGYTIDIRLIAAQGRRPNNRRRSNARRAA